MKDYLKDSVLQDADMFYYNWVWIEDFSDMASKEDNGENLDVGLDLSIERKWDFMKHRARRKLAIGLICFIPLTRTRRSVLKGDGGGKESSP